VEIRPGRAEECEALSALALRSKAHWGYDEAFLASCRIELLVRASDLETGTVRVAVELGGRPVGFAALGPPSGREIELTKLFVEPTSLGRGIGAALFRAGTDVARALGASTMRIESDPHAASFYERMGAVLVGRVASGSIPGRWLPVFVLQLSRE
jgi:GNAT superfamily N-acetyltransferase